MTKKSSVVRTDSVLWEACKKEAVEKLGKFSARAMQQAVVLYKKRGGEYVGIKPIRASVNEWEKKRNKN